MLAHFIQDIPEIGYDHDEIYIELCDLVASKGKHETLRRGGGGIRVVRPISHIALSEIFFFWNSRGLSDLTKIRCLLDAEKEHNLDFVTVM